MKLRIKQYSLNEMFKTSYSEVVLDLTYSEIMDVLDIIPNEKIKEISLTIAEPEADNGKEN